MPKSAPTLRDTIYRMTFRNEPIMGFEDNADLRTRLVAARPFVLDDKMSGFLGELATRAFVPFKGDADKPDPASYPYRIARMIQQAEAMRVSARLPHKSVWIEYNLREANSRSHALLRQPFDPAEAPKIEGWLIEQHPQLDVAYRMHLFTWNPDPAEADSHGFQVWAFPVMFTWTADDTVSPWRSILGAGSSPDATVASAIMGHETPSVSIAQSELMGGIRYKPSGIVALLREWAGVGRRAWALLATINDLPLVYSDVRASKGFVARGRYRRFLDHRTITINVPQKDQTKLAKQLITLIRHRAHQVRGHWRDDWRQKPSARCPQLVETGLHAWNAEGFCERCHGHRIWVHEHQRGDASLGFVTHDYLVKHDEVRPETGQGGQSFSPGQNQRE